VPAREWVAVSDQARLHSEANARFIVPPELTLADFRAFAERTIYAGWKDGTQAFFDPAFGVEWMRRMRQLAGSPGASGAARFPTEDDVVAGYRRLDAAAFVLLARESWGAGGPVYAVRRRADAPLDLTTAFSTADYVVYRVTER
jgi:hypothetical protein